MDVLIIEFLFTANPPEKRAWYETARAHLNEEQKRQLERFGPQDLIKRTWLDSMIEYCHFIHFKIRLLVSVSVP
jgi:hypothetical protein